MGIGYALARKLPKTGAAAQSGQGARIVKSSSDEKKMTHGDWMSFACMSLLHPRVSKCRGLSAERIADPCLHIHAPWMCAIWHDAQHAIETTGSLLSTSGTYTRTSLHCSVTVVCFISRLRHFVPQEDNSSFRIGGQPYYPFMSDDHYFRLFETKHYTNWSCGM